LTDEILSNREMEAFIRSWVLIPGTGGVFDVTINGDLVFSKHELGRHAEPGEVRALIETRLAALRGDASEAE
jgi:selenoprotein W-related protein